MCKLNFIAICSATKICEDLLSIIAWTQREFILISMYMSFVLNVVVVTITLITSGLTVITWSLDWAASLLTIARRVSSRGQSHMQCSPMQRKHLSSGGAPLGASLAGGALVGTEPNVVLFPLVLLPRPPLGLEAAGHFSWFLWGERNLEGSTEVEVGYDLPHRSTKA